MPLICSDAIPARWPPHSISPIRISLQRTSRRFWTSPCTFCASVPTRAPLWTWLAIIFTAVATAFSRPEKSPVESGWRCSVSMVYRVSVLRTSGTGKPPRSRRRRGGRCVLRGLLDPPAGQEVLRFEPDEVVLGHLRRAAVEEPAGVPQPGPLHGVANAAGVGEPRLLPPPGEIIAEGGTGGRGQLVTSLGDHRGPDLLEFFQGVAGEVDMVRYS